MQFHVCQLLDFAIAVFFKGNVGNQMTYHDTYQNNNMAVRLLTILCRANQGSAITAD